MHAQTFYVMCNSFAKVRSCSHQHCLVQLTRNLERLTPPGAVLLGWFEQNPRLPVQTKQLDSGPLQKGLRPRASQLWSSSCELQPYHPTMQHASIHSKILHFIQGDV